MKVNGKLLWSGDVLTVFGGELTGACGNLVSHFCVCVSVWVGAYVRTYVCALQIPVRKFHARLTM